QAEDGIRDRNVTGVQTCALPIWFILFGLTVTVLLSGWMMAHYAILVSLFIALSRPPDNTDAHPETRYRQDGRLQFPASREQKFRSEERRVGKECRTRWTSKTRYG